MDSISEQAARWAIQADRGTLQRHEQAELDAWLAADPRHRGAYVRARTYWTDIDRLAALSGPASVNPPPDDGRVNLNRRRLLAAASVGALTLMGGITWYLTSQPASRPIPANRYLTGTGEVKDVRLDDGSSLLLNTRSEIRVLFSAQQRVVQLLRGEVLFKVAHDVTRPFIVNTENGCVRAVGTAFGVHIDSNQADVTVTEGVVEVVNSPVDLASGRVLSRSAASRTRVMALQRVALSGKGVPQVHSITSAEAERQYAWRDGMVFFKGDALQSAVSEINRYNNRQIVVDDLKLAAQPIVGVFKATDPETFSAGVAAALDARVITEGKLIRIEPRSPSGD